MLVGEKSFSPFIIDIRSVQCCSNDDQFSLSFLLTVRTVDIQAVEGRSLVMPCPILSPIRDVYMVLWFKDNAGIPLYRWVLY